MPITATENRASSTTNNEEEAEYVPTIDTNGSTNSPTKSKSISSRRNSLRKSAASSLSSQGKKFKSKLNTLSQKHSHISAVINKTPFVRLDKISENETTDNSPPGSSSINKATYDELNETSGEFDISDEFSNLELAESPYWKYHILKYGKDLYLTTNPSLKHVYCRNGPGYFVEVINRDKRNSRPNPSNGFTLIFKDLNNMTTSSSGIEIEEVFKITKKPDLDGGEYIISIPDTEKNYIFNGLIEPKKLNQNYVHNQSTAIPKFINYEFEDFHNVRWNIGSIPRVKLSKSKNLMQNLKTHDINPADTYTFVGKRNIYFHRNYIDARDHNTIDRISRQEPFPRVLAAFRPYEVKIRKRIVHNINRGKEKTISHLNNNTNLRPSTFKGSELNEDLGAGANIKKYYIGGDGLYYDKNPSDDNPDDNKLGWITIYEDNEIFTENNKGMFEMVLGLTLACSIEVLDLRKES